MTGRIKAIKSYMSGKVQDMNRLSLEIKGTIPAKGNAVWFDIFGTPHRVLGFAIGEHDLFGMVCLPIIDKQYDLPSIDANIMHVRFYGFQGLFYEEVHEEDVMDNFEVYGKYRNSLVTKEQYKHLVESCGVKIIY